MDVSTFMFKVLAAGFRDEAGETALSGLSGGGLWESSGHVDLLSSGSEEHQRTLMRRSDTRSVL